jgi:hypothetical protein
MKILADVVFHRRFFLRGFSSRFLLGQFFRADIDKIFQEEVRKLFP